MDLLTIITSLIIISALFSYLNERIIKLPGAIGLVTISIVVSIFILVIRKTNTEIANSIITFARSIDFSKVLLNIMLGFLMFAGAFHLDYRKLKEQQLPVFLLSTLGVIISTGVFGSFLYLLTALLNLDLPIIYCFLFGAIVSPTDPIAVGAILKNSKVPPRLNTIISGESLFNDGAGLILFIIILRISQNPSDISLTEILKIFAREVFGGISIGLVLGYLGYELIKTINGIQTIFLISIALVMGISIIADNFHSSIPLAAVTAGLIVGNKSTDRKHISDLSLRKIWQLVNDLLNTILFVMIGLQMVTMPFLHEYWVIGLISIVILLISRLISIIIPAVVLLHRFNIGNLSILTWVGLRGGISIAMALTLPPSPYRELILASCYFVVVFSIIFQGLTLTKIVKIGLRFKAY